jgi:hypothetical protein
LSLRDDVLLRAIHQLVEALLRAAGLRRKKDIPGAEQALGEGLNALGLPLELVARLDDSTLRNLLPDEERRALVGAALIELAQLRDDDALEETGRALINDIDDDALPDEVRLILSSRRG